MLDDDVLLAVAAAWAALVLVRSARSPALREAGQRRGWVAAGAVVLAIAAALAWLQPDGRGWVALGAAVLLLVVPVRLTQFYFRLILGQRYRAAQAVSVILLLLHPTRSLLTDRAVLAALRRAAAGDAAGALAGLGAVIADERLPEPLRLSARAWAGRIRRDWPGVVELPDGPVTRAMRLRGYGELGRTEALVRGYGRPGRDTSPLERLMLFAFCGYPDAVDRLVAGPLAAFRRDTRAFWRATARFAAGREVAAEALLRATAPRDAEMRASFEDRLRHHPPVPTLSPEARAAVERAAAEVAAVPLAATGRPWVTWLLILVNVAVFAVEEASGGSTDSETLFRLGALWPPAVLDEGAVWRVGSAMFLHAGLAHVLFNMAALAVFGARVERRLGRLRFALVYFGAGLLSMAAVLALTEAGAIQPALLVGASGAIMGLVGAIAGLAARTVRTDPAASYRALRSAALIVALQAVFDLLVPQVSFVAHAAGAFSGFALTLVMPGVARR